MDHVLAPPPPPPPGLRKPRRPGNWWRTFRAVGATIVTIVLASLFINASDNLHNLSNSLLGSTILSTQPTQTGKCPADMVFVETANGGFCIDRYEDSPSAACPNQDPQSQTQTRDNLTADGCIPESVADHLPWVSISQNQAILACARAGKRLPTNDEWYRAALGTPDGPENDRGCLLYASGASTAERTGSRSACASSAGAVDMIGNVWEWVDGTIYEGTYGGHPLPPEGYIHGVGSDGMPTETDPTTPDPNYYGDYFWIDHTGTRAMFRGGYWGVGERGGFYAVHGISPPSFVGGAVGFRCAKDRNAP